MVAKPGLGSLVDPGHALATNLLTSYLFNEGSGTTAADSSGNGHAMTLNLTAIAWGLSSYFTGSSPALISSATAGTTGGTLSPGLAGTTFSIEAWVTYQTSDTYAALLASNANAQTLYIHGGKLDARTTAAGDHDGATTLTPGASYQLVLTADATHARLYVNAALDLTAAMTYASLSPGFVINGGGSETFVGTYDLLRIWAGRTLTGAEITTLYGDPFDMYVAANPLAWFSSVALRGMERAPVALPTADTMARALGWLHTFDDVMAADLPWLRARDGAVAQKGALPLEQRRYLSAGALAALGITAQPWWLDGVNIGKGFDRG